MAAKKTAAKATAKKTATKKKTAAKKTSAKKPAAKKPARKKPATRKAAVATPSPEDLQAEIRQTAYYIAEKSGWWKDPALCWIEAEAEVTTRAGR